MTEQSQSTSGAPVGLREAARALLDACLAADAKGDLDGAIDGSLLDAVSNALAAQPPATEPTKLSEAERHARNEWADMAANGLQWLRNIVEGISNPKAALANMEENMEHCRQVNDDACAKARAAGVRP